MPNYVKTIINFHGDENNIKAVLDCVHGHVGKEETAFDFNKLIPMPESLNIEESSSTERGINLYLTSINPDVDYLGEDKDKMSYEEFFKLMAEIKKIEFKSYTCTLSLNDINAIKEEKLILGMAQYDYEKIFSLGKAAVNNFIQYGATTWYSWCYANWNTKWNACDVELYDCNCLCLSTAWGFPAPVINEFSELCAQHNVKFDGKWSDEIPGENAGEFNGGVGGFCGTDYEDDSSSAYKAYVECWGVSNCIGIDNDGNYYHYDCDTCPNKCM